VSPTARTYRTRPSCAASRSVVFLLATSLSVVLTIPRAGKADEFDSLEKGMLKKAPQILRFLQAKRCKNVGVLKFRVKKPNEPITDNAGTLNMKVARQLEMALILANTVQDPIGVVHNASAVAIRTSGANHLTPEGRKKLFEARYPLAWGREEVTPDIFLTGVVESVSGLHHLRVHVLAFTKESKNLQKVLSEPFLASVRPQDLVDAGESFLLRGSSRGRKGKEVVPEQDDVGDPGSPDEAIEAAVRVMSDEQAHPLSDRKAPVALEIRYHNRPVPLTIENGVATVPEPGEGEEVTLVLRRRVKQGRFAVVLKVNGLNAVEKQRLPDLQCRKYVLSPGDGPLQITGFQIGDNAVEKFRVLSPAQSKAKEMHYGEDVGLISLAVFREQTATPDSQVAQLNEDAEDVAVLTRAEFGQETPANLDALKHQLRETGATRGIIEGGKKVESETVTVDFTPDPTPVMVATIRYYRPK
jgi:hypothetical protein